VKVSAALLGSALLVVFLGACSRGGGPHEAVVAGGPSIPASLKAQTIDPAAILFSLPTLCDALPPLAPPVERAPSGSFQLHEDDWRQIEFVGNGDRQAVERELAELRTFKKTNQAGVGWKNVFVRSGRPEAIRASRVGLRRLLDMSGGDSRLLFIETGEGSSEVRGGFAIPLGDGAFLYGFAFDGKVVSLSLQLDRESSGGRNVRISKIERAFGLFVVDWYRAEILPS